MSKGQNELLRGKPGVLGLVDTDGQYRQSISQGQKMMPEVHVILSTCLSVEDWYFVSRGSTVMLQGITLFLLMAKTTYHPPGSIIPFILFTITSLHTHEVLSGHI